MTTASLIQRAVETLGAEGARALLRPDEVEHAAYIRELIARPAQLPPLGEWATWVVMAGRGFGKTWTGAQETVSRSERVPRIALVAPTAADARDIMVEGESGILACSPPWNRPKYEPSKRRITWPNGCIAQIFSGEDPDQLRGPNNLFAWCDELAAWKYPQDTWDNLQMTMRVMGTPQRLVTTTPRPIKTLKDILALESTIVTGGSSYENRANLADQFVEETLAQYEGTRLGRQEIHAEILDDIEGALWQYDWIANNRVSQAPELERVIVAVDPAATHGPDADDTGICVAGRGIDGEFYVLFSGKYKLTPDGWGRKAVEVYDRYQADRIIGEVNQGGDMVVSTIGHIRANLPVGTVRAFRGKRLRAEPVTALYEQGRVHHVGIHQDLEDQQIAFTGDDKDEDDLVDADVYALSELSGKRQGYTYQVLTA